MLKQPDTADLPNNHRSAFHALSTMGVFVLSILAISGCTQVNVVPGRPTAAAATPAESTDSSTIVRQTDDAGRHLPFTTTFARRWSNGNDGTTYEPCTAATTEILSTNHLDPDSVKDAAIADHQTARGCRWSTNAYESAYLSQIVGNQPQLDIYKQRQDGFVAWLPDIAMGDRRAAVGSSPSATDCTTFVQSGEAIIATRASVNISPPPINKLCDKAIAFTRATIDQMPE